MTETSQEQGSFTLGAVAEETITESSDEDSGEEDADTEDEDAEDAEGAESSDESSSDESESRTARLTVISAGSLIDSQITDSFTILRLQIRLRSLRMRRYS